MTAIHPGEHLAEELKELGMTAAEPARKLDVPTNRITGILNGQRAIMEKYTAIRVGNPAVLRHNSFFASSKCTSHPY